MFKKIVYLPFSRDMLKEIKTSFPARVSQYFQQAYELPLLKNPIEGSSALPYHLHYTFKKQSRPINKIGYFSLKKVDCKRDKAVFVWMLVHNYFP